MQTIRLAIVIGLLLALAWPAAVHADDIIHTVQPGENLFRIGLSYGVDWRTIAAANGLTTTRIYAGQQLRIPGAGSALPAGPAVPETQAPAPAAVSEAAAPAPATYTVARGDTLAGIARRFGLTPAALVAANSLANPDWIFAGQVLNIPGGTAAAAVSEAAAPAAAPASRQILVDISEQHMYVYENGGLLWSWVTSTGERGRDTAPGNYSVLNKIPNAYASTWNLWMPSWLGIYWAGRLQNGIHALPILSDGSQLWAGWLGTPVSYGCVILDNAEAQTLYNWAEVGTPVTVRW
jgi:LysM repeat protein